MTELSSKDETSSVPAPPSPPAPLYEDDPRRNQLDDGGPATSAMGALPADEARNQGFGGGFTTFTPVPGDILGNPPTAPTRVVRGPESVRIDGKAERKRRVTVRGPRRAKLVLRRVDPWSVLKFSILFSVALLIIWVVAVSSLFTLLRTMHVFENINSVLASATSDPTSKGIHIDPTSDQVTHWAAIIGAVNALLFTALATLGAFAYNLVAMLVGGIEVTLAERD
jgi:hypothetical protein